MIKINLLPYREEQRRQQLIVNGIALAIGFSLAIFVCAGLFTYISTKLTEARNSIAKADLEINQLKPKLKEIEDFKAKQKELKEKIDVLDDLKRSRSGPVHLMEDLSLVLPEKLWISSFKESGGVIKIDGVGLNEKTVADFMTALEDSLYYKEVVLVEIKQAQLSDNSVQGFVITCKRDKPAATPKDKRG